MATTSPTDASPAPVPDPLARLASASKGELVFHHVRREILLGIVASGEQLLEQRIAATVGCSQGTVREALLRLEQEGLVERRGYRGTIVVEPGLREVAEMVRIREAIECAGLRRSVPDFPEATLERLEQFAAGMDRERGGDRDEYRLSELDRGFHLCLLREAALPALEPIFLRCALNHHRIVARPDRSRRPSDGDNGDQHRELIAAVRTRNVALAERAIRDHINLMVSGGAPALLEFLGEPSIANDHGDAAG